MPRWSIRHSPGVFTDSEKEVTSQKITDFYTKVVHLPAFYVQVVFTELPTKTMFLGGKEHTKFASIEIHHVARLMKDAGEDSKSFMDAVDDILTPLFQAMGVQWEHWVTESDPALWKIDGTYPPPPGSELERKWAELNRVVKE